MRRAPGIPWLGPRGLLKSPQDFLSSVYPKLGPIFRVRLLGRDWVVLAGREASRFFAKSPEKIWGRKSLFHHVIEDLGTETFIPALEGDEKEFYRKIMQLSFSRHVLTPHFSRLLPLIRDTVGSWPMNKSISIVDTFGRLASDQMGFITANRSLKHVFQDIEKLMFPMFGVPLGLLPPFVLRLRGYQSRKRRIFSFLDEVIREHRAASRKSSIPATSSIFCCCSVTLMANR